MGYVLLIFSVFYVGFRFVLCRILPVSLDCPLFIAPSVFSNVYFLLLNCSSLLFT